MTTHAKGELAGWLAVFVLMLAGVIVLAANNALTPRAVGIVIVAALVPRVGFALYLWVIEHGGAKKSFTFLRARIANLLASG